MGTNYYLVYESKPPCEACCRPFEKERKHIGKSSWGWRFSLHVIPEDGINSLDDWKREWSKPNSFIENEYGERVSIDKLLDIITKRYPGRFCQADQQLAAHPIGPYCVGRGEGPWDLVPGEFS
jgi:hypothetical protein